MQNALRQRKYNPRTMPVKLARRIDGLNVAEGEVMDALCDAVEAFDDLESQHPDEVTEFYAAIHRLQDLLAVRAMRRLFPEGWVNTAGST